MPDDSSVDQYAISSDVADRLYDFGNDLKPPVVGMICETFFMSVYTIFFIMALYSIFRKGLKARQSIIMLCVVIYLYATSLSLWALNITYLLTTLKAFLLTPSVLSLSSRLDLANDWNEPLFLPMEVLFMFNMIVGDSVVIWRAWVLYPHRRWLMTIPLTMLLTSLVFTIIDIPCLTSGVSTQSAVAGNGPVCTHAELISWAVSLGTNASCTILIGFRAWQHRRAMRELNFIQNPRRLSTNRVLSLLVESGSLYCLFWLTQVILFIPAPASNLAVSYAYSILGALGDQISGLYPTLIIVIVNFHQTIWESEAFTEHGPDLELPREKMQLSTLRFAQDVGNTRTQADSETQIGSGASCQRQEEYRV